MVATYLTRASALLLGSTGIAHLFSADYIMARVAPGTPASAAWIGQMFGAALIALAWLNWLNQRVLLGGIYGRPVVLPNAAFYFISALSVLRAASRVGSQATMLWVSGGILAVFAVAYGWLLYRGPIEADIRRYRREAGHAS